MRGFKPSEQGSQDEASQPSRLLWPLVGAFIVAVLIGLIAKRHREGPTGPVTADQLASSAPNPHSPGGKPQNAPRRRLASDAKQTPEEIVAAKLVLFVKKRRQLAYAMAEHFKTPVTDDIERFFDAAESGRYDEMTAIYKSLRQQREGGTNAPWYGPQWRAVIETQGAADAVHDWPAQTLLNYGNAVLDSLRPGMIYAGGTDPGCFIPTMLNETSESDQHIVLTQNALADNTYLKYLDFLYRDKMVTLTEDDSQRAFQEYLADAQKRMQHDIDFPNEPKQLKPGEDVRMTDGRLQVSGQVAVMAINEKLFQTMINNNPDASFAMEESFPFQSMFTNATTLGPVMELRVKEGQNALTAERAAQSVDYWRAISQQLVSNPETPDTSDPRKAYSKLVSSQAGLLLDRGYSAEAERAFRIANELCPYSPEAVFRYVNLLMSQNRMADAASVAENATKAAPDNQQFQNLLQQLNAAKGPAFNSRP